MVKVLGGTGVGGAGKEADLREAAGGEAGEDRLLPLLTPQKGR